MVFLNLIKKCYKTLSYLIYFVYHLIFIRPKELYREDYFKDRTYEWDKLTRKVVDYSSNIPFIGFTSKKYRRHFRDWHSHTIHPRFFLVEEYLGGYIDEYEKALHVQDQNDYFDDDYGSGVGHSILFFSGELMGGDDINFSPFVYIHSAVWIAICLSAYVLIILDQGFASWAWYSIFKDYNALVLSNSLEFRNIFGVLYMLIGLWCQDPYWRVVGRADWFEILHFYSGLKREIVRGHYKLRVRMTLHNIDIMHYATLQQVESWLYNELNIDLKRSEYALRVNYGWWFGCYFRYYKIAWLDYDLMGAIRAQMNYFFYSKKVYYTDDGTLITTIHRGKKWKKSYLRYIFYERLHNDGEWIRKILHNYGPESRDFFHISWLWRGFPKRDERLEDFHFTFGSSVHNQIVAYTYRVFVQTESDFGRRFLPPVMIWFFATLPFPFRPTYLYDAPRAFQIGFQDPATPIMEGIIDLHHDLFFFFIVIGCLVFWLIFRIIYIFQWEGYVVPENFFRTIKHHTMIEVIWTITPALILVLIATPSFSLLYAMEDIIKPGLTIKVIGHQWYWSYEYFVYPTEENKEIFNFTNTRNNTLEKIFDSYMIDTKDLQLGEFRLLEVDNRVIVPTLTHIRFLITSTDVLHSFAVPSLGIKLDACPGRLNQTTAFITRQGLFYGQCSEICGINHAFMPIAIEAVDAKSMVVWLNK